MARFRLTADSGAPWKPAVPVTVEWEGDHRPTLDEAVAALAANASDMIRYDSVVVERIPSITTASTED